MQRAGIEEQRRSARGQASRQGDEEENGNFWLLGEEGARNDGRISAPSLRHLGVQGLRVSLPHDFLSAII